MIYCASERKAVNAAHACPLSPRASRDFPASRMGQAAAAGPRVFRAIERQWTLGEVVTRLAEVGLTLERLEEHPEQYWPLFRDIPEAIGNRLPHTFSLLMRKAQPT
jgi:hypothetical protein